MKKQKLTLNKLNVKSFKTATSTVKGGTLVLTEIGCIQDTINWCPTIHYTNCGPRLYCEIYSNGGITCS